MKKYDCLFVGNAIVDVVANVSFDFLKDQNIDVGSWRPTKLDEISQLQNKMKDTLVASGGSAANSAVGFSFLGGKYGSEVQSEVGPGGAPSKKWQKYLLKRPKTD